MPLQETKEASSLALLIGITPKYAKEHDNTGLYLRIAEGSSVKLCATLEAYM